jgi:4a-hydroxytetrahydrobiopterin dehydratase
MDGGQLKAAARAATMPRLEDAMTPPLNPNLPTPTLIELQRARCTALPARIEVLPAVSAARLLATLPSGWRLTGRRSAIEKTFDFGDFYQTMAFVNAVAFVAHQHDHHPDLSVSYQRCVVRLTSHDAGGLTLRDFIVAAYCEGLLARDTAVKPVAG